MNIELLDRVNVGAVGTGSIFLGAHLPVYPKIEEAKLIAIYDIDERRLARAEAQIKLTYEQEINAAEAKGDSLTAERLREDIDNLKVYSSLEELLDYDKLDLIDLCTMPDSHASIAVKALKANINVMCEKPMARSYLECLEVIEAVEASGKFYQHNENYIYMPTWYTAKKYIDSGAIGELQLMFIATAHSGPEWSIRFWEPLLSGGGALIDNGIHAVTTSWFLAGFDRKPIKVKAAQPNGLSLRMPERILEGRLRGFEVEDDAHVLILFEDAGGKSWSAAHIEGSWSDRDSPDNIIVGTIGKLGFASRDGNPILVLTDNFDRQREIPLSLPDGISFWQTGFYGEIRNMCKCIIEGKKPYCDENIGAESTAIVGAAYLSQREGMRAITLDEFKDYAKSVRKKFGERATEVLIEELLKGIKHSRY